VIRTITPAGLIDEELRQSDQATRRWYGRVLMLANDTGCTLPVLC